MDKARSNLINKGIRLANSDRVTQIEMPAFEVIGDHGTYVVYQINKDHEVRCTCPTVGVCSHMIGVITHTKTPIK